MSFFSKFRVLSGRRKKRWGIFFLLGLAILEPIVCIVWLVQVAAKNENLANQQLLENSRVDRMAATRARLERDFAVYLDEIATVTRSARREALPQLVEEKGVLGFWRLDGDEGLELGEEYEVGEKWAAELLAKIRDERDSAAKRSLVREGLEDERLAWAMSPESGRSYAALLALLGLDFLGDELTGEQAAAIEKVVFGYSDFPMKAGQRRLLLKAYAEKTKSEKARRFLRAEDVASQLRERATAGNLESGGSGKWEDGYYMVERTGLFAVVISASAFEEIKKKGLASLSDDRGYAFELIDSSRADPENARMVALDEPLLGWRLAMSVEGADEMTASRRFGYEWVVSIVIGFSVAIALVLVGSLRKEMAVAQLKNDLVATVSHELKTPVASIRLLVDTLNKSENLDTVRAKEYLQLIAKENRRLGLLIENFLSFSRMEPDKKSFYLEGLDAGVLLEQAEEVFRDRRTSADFELSVKVEAEMRPILADREAILTAVSNLLENAYKYGGRDRRIELSARAGEKGAVIEVRDFGEGIPKGERQKIFERFYQGSHTEGPNTGGVGLGLSIVSFIMAKHQGEVELESEIGKGSVFRLRVPYA